MLLLEKISWKELNNITESINCLHVIKTYELREIAKLVNNQPKFMSPTTVRF